MQTRDGSRTAPVFRASIGLADSELLGEGRLGHEDKGSWLASVRKSYLGYLLRNRLNDPYDDVSFYDGALKLTYDIRPTQRLSFYSVGGHTRFDQLNGGSLGINEFKSGTNDFVMARTGWRWTLNPHLLFDARAAYLEAPYTTRNLDHQDLDKDHHGEWVAAGSLVWSWQKDEVLEAGWMARRVNDTLGFTFYDQNGVPSTSIRGGAGWKNDGYLQQTASFLGNRLHVVGGLRLDTAEQFDIHPVSPQISASLQVASATQIQFGVGRYNQFQFPATGLTELPFGFCIPGSETLQTANHYMAGIEQRFGEGERVRVTLFDRQSGTSYAENQVPGCTVPPYFPLPHGFTAVERDYSRGAQIVLQSRSANRLSGWIGYTLTYARQSLVGSINFFPTLEDQRHTLNVFASYRLTPTVHVSGK
jgi:hypothetical protein